MTTQAGEGTGVQGQQGADNGADQNAEPQEGQKPQLTKEQADEVARLREINQRLKGQLTDVEKKYKTFSDIYKDIDPDEAKALKSQLAEAERKAAQNDPAKLEELFERKFTKFRSDYEAKEQALTGEMERIKAENKSLRVTDRVMAEIAALFNQDALKFIKREVEERCDLDEDGSIVVKNEHGEAIFRNGKYLGIKDFGEMLVEQFPSLAKSTGSSGGKDANAGVKVTVRGLGRVPETWAELQAMPNAKEVLDKLKRENPAAVQKILATMRA